MKWTRKELRVGYTEGGTELLPERWRACIPPGVSSPLR